MHSEMWWPRLFRCHGEIAWDDYEKDYSDLPEEVLQRHRCGGQAAGRQGCMARVGGPGRVLPSCTPCSLSQPMRLSPCPSDSVCRVAEAIKGDERQAETTERERREALQVPAVGWCWCSWLC